MSESDQQLSLTARIDQAVEAYHARLQAGEEIEREAFLNQYPEIQSELRSRLAAELDPSSALRETQIIEEDSIRLSDRLERPQTGPLRAGDEFGRYRIVRLLGQGAMGTVYLAHDNHLDREVAIKIPFFSESHREELEARFDYEARAAATLEHPGICAVHDFGTIDGHRYLSMAYIEGVPLSKAIAGREPMEQRRAATLVSKVADAIHAAHAADIIHRDLKPANIMLRNSGDPVVMDFGLACRMGTDDPRLNDANTSVGTPAYMPPEQVTGGSECLGPSADQYSLGVVLYELLTGDVPYTGNLVEVLKQIREGNPRPIHELRTNADSDLVAICNRMMAVETVDRYRSMEEVVSALEEWLDADTASTRHIEATGRVTPEQETDRLRSEVASKSRLVIGLMGIVIVLLIVVIILLSQ